MYAPESGDENGQCWRMVMIRSIPSLPWSRATDGGLHEGRQSPSEEGLKLVGQGAGAL